jgi:hypothetical protein
MLTGYVDEVRRQYIAGWAFDPDNPDSRVEVAVFIHGDEVGRTIANLPRPDLVKLGKYGDGRHGFMFRFDLPLSLIGTYDVIVRFPQGEVLQGGRFTIGKELIEPQEDLPPILLTSTGRSGTSLMMRRLGHDRSIVVAGAFPYEMKLLTYYAHAFEILTAAGNHQKSLDPTLIFNDTYHLGLNPFNHVNFADTFPRPYMIHDFFEKQSAPIIADAFKAIVSRFYDHAGKSQSKHSAKYFAEKCEVFNPTRDFTRAVYGKMREIILVRDPRDVFCSYRSFWSTPTEQSAQILRSVRDKMLDFKREASSDSLFVRYEDMVRQPEEVLARISEFLGLDHVITIDPSVEEADFKVHATSRDSGSSIGRWRSELSSEEFQQFNTDFGEFFEAFGYDTTVVASDDFAAAT